MATKKAAPRRPRPALYVAVTVIDSDGSARPVVFPTESPNGVARADYARAFTLDAILRKARPAVGESVTITIHGTAKAGFIGGKGGEE